MAIFIIDGVYFEIRLRNYFLTIINKWAFYNNDTKTLRMAPVYFFVSSYNRS